MGVAQITRNPDQDFAASNCFYNNVFTWFHLTRGLLLGSATTGFALPAPRHLPNRANAAANSSPENDLQHDKTEEKRCRLGDGIAERNIGDHRNCRAPPDSVPETHIFRDRNAFFGFAPEAADAKRIARLSESKSSPALSDGRPTTPFAKAKVKPRTGLEQTERRVDRICARRLGSARR